MALKFTFSSQTSLLGSRLPYTAAYSICPLGITHVVQTLQVQNSHFSLPERIVPSSMNLANPEDRSHYWLTYLYFTVISIGPSFWLYLLNISLTVDFSLSVLSPKLSPDYYSSMTHHSAATYLMPPVPFYTADYSLKIHSSFYSLRNIYWAPTICKSWPRQACPWYPGTLLRT